MRGIGVSQALLVREIRIFAFEIRLFESRGPHARDRGLACVA